MMPKIQIATLACLLLLLCSSWACSQGPSFDCSKATTAVERMICADTELSRLDLELDRLYEIALKQAQTGNAARATTHMAKRARTICGCCRSSLDLSGSNRSTHFFRSCHHCSHLPPLTVKRPASNRISTGVITSGFYSAAKASRLAKRCWLISPHGRQTPRRRSALKSVCLLIATGPVHPVVT